jgi:hypothetical protein
MTDSGRMRRDLIGEQLNAVCFVLDYVELCFDGPIVRAFTGPIVRSGDESVIRAFEPSQPPNFRRVSASCWAIVAGRREPKLP